MMIAACGGSIAEDPRLGSSTESEASTVTSTDAASETSVAEASPIEVSPIDVLMADGDTATQAARSEWAIAEGRVGFLFRGPSAALDASARATFAGHFDPKPTFGSASGCDGSLVIVRLNHDGKYLFRRCLSDLYEGNSLAVGTDGATYVGTYVPSPSGAWGLGAHKLDEKGATVWSKVFRPATQSNDTMARALSLAGSDVVLGGHTKLPVDFGPGQRGGRAESTGIVLRLAAATGATVWARALGDCSGCGRTDVLAVAGTPTCTYVAGYWMLGPTDLGQGVLSASKGSFVGALDGKGGTRWMKLLAVGFPSLAVGSGGELVLAGSTSLAIDFGNGVTVGPGGYLAVLEPDGSARWAKNVGYAVAISPVDAGIWIGGSKDDAGVQGALLAQYAWKDGALLAEGWSGRAAATAWQEISGVGASNAGVAVVGGFKSSIRFGATTLTNVGPPEAGPFASGAFFARIGP